VSHGAQTKYFMRFLQPPLTPLLLAGIRHSCNPPSGQAYPQNNLPKNIDRTIRIENVTKLPPAIPFDAPSIIR